MTTKPLPSIAVVTPPAEEPITLAEAKLFLRIDHNDEDAFISDLIIAARESAESFTKKSLITQTIRMSYDDYAPMQIDLLKGKIQSITSVKFITADENETTLTNDQYYLSAGNSKIIFKITPLSHRIEIDYVAGYGDASQVPQAIKQGLKTHIAYMYENRLGRAGVHHESRQYYMPFRESYL